jgi:hypothetical protein
MRNEIFTIRVMEEADFIGLFIDSCSGGKKS